MTNVPHFLRLARALSLGAVAGPLMCCAPAATQLAPTAAQPTAEPSSGTQSPADSPLGATPQSSSPRPTESASSLPRTGALCDAGGSVHRYAEGSTLQRCHCVMPTTRGDTTPSRWQCTPTARSTGGLDGQPCATLGSDHADTGARAATNLCYCVLNGTRQEHACFHAYNVMAGPLAPPECDVEGAA